MNPNRASLAAAVTRWGWLPLATLVLLASCRTAEKADRATRKPTPPTFSQTDRELQLRSFDHVWETVRDRHWDPTLGGIDWEAQRDELRPRVEKAKTADEARAAIQTLLSRLGQSHFAIFPADVYDDLREPEEETSATNDTPALASPGDASPPTATATATSGPDTDEEPRDEPGDATSKKKKEGEAGLTVRVLEGKALVTSVLEGSKAESLRVKPGWAILSIEGWDLAPAIERASTREHGELLAMGIMGRLDGKLGDTRSVTFENGTGQTIKLEIPLIAARGSATAFGNLPKIQVYFESRKLEGNVGYMTFNMFFDPVNLMKGVNEAVREFKDCRGVIIDLRGNPGGIGGLSMGLASHFVKEKGQQLGRMITRAGEMKFALFPRSRPFEGPLAILVDELTASTSEIFAGGMKDIGRARIFGHTSMGAALPSIIERLPSGDGFQYAMANYISDGGEPLEGNGVIPDEEIRPTREQLLEGRDPVLEAAVRWIVSSPTEG